MVGIQYSPPEKYVGSESCPPKGIILVLREKYEVSDAAGSRLPCAANGCIKSTNQQPEIVNRDENNGVTMDGRATNELGDDNPFAQKICSSLSTVRFGSGLVLHPTKVNGRQVPAG